MVAKKRGYKPRYTREEVLEAAIGMFESPSGEPVTMRRLADHLGLGVMTLYGYVANRDDLFEGVATLMFRDLGAEVSDAAPWDEHLRAQAVGIHDIVVRHPNLARALRAEGPPNPHLFRVRERMLAVLVGAGFTPEGALQAVGVITGYSQGFAMVQSAAPDDATVLDRVRELPADQFPLLHALSEAYPSHVSTASFTQGLEWIIGGLRHELQGARPESPCCDDPRRL